jgi:hypothetical protein
MDALQRALEVAGVEFTNGDRPGVRLIRPAERAATWKNSSYSGRQDQQEEGVDTAAPLLSLSVKSGSTPRDAGDADAKFLFRFQSKN